MRSLPGKEKEPAIGLAGQRAIPPPCAKTMPANFPAFFADAPRITLHDPLAEFLGSATDGRIEYGYADAVRLAGHSCPTVAGAWLMTVHGLRVLYKDATPVRGDIAARLREPRDSGTTGVVASIVQLITGAAAETGFHGIGSSHRFSRHQLLQFAARDQAATLSLTRRDSGQSVHLDLDPSCVPWPAEMQSLMPRAVSGQATPAERARFAYLWQERVRQMLIEHADDPRLVHVTTA